MDNNIKKLLWDENITTVKEYLDRLYFYGSLNKLGEGSMSNMDNYQELLARIEEIEDSMPDHQSYSKGLKIRIDNFGWKEIYNRQDRLYLRKGLESFEIY